MAEPAVSRLIRLGEGIGTLGGRWLTRATLLGAIAAGVWWWGSPAPGDTERQHLAQLGAKNDALQIDNQRLRNEISELGYKNEILHWQLRYSEQTLRQTRDGLEGTGSAIQGGGSFARPSVPPTPARRVPSQAVIVSVEHVSSPEGVDGQAVDGDVLSDGIHRSLSLDGSDVEIPELDADVDPFARDQAFAVWQGIVDEAVRGECGRHLSSAGGYKCSNELKRDLWPYGTLAVSCMLSGNAVPDYVGSVRLDALPSHSIPLEHGAIILCDGALRNRRR